ncbi:phage tail tape measure protein [Halostella sp. PRR32]|uniref:phage tail tape measure protein n=1 Tax=Halostella sp. PRR32 TaxID=3098147 RepID=UPI002B1D59A0|nr:phage tail tape measure protein [Halostella sp. PRR32]
MAFEELTGTLELDASDYESGVNSAADSSEELVSATAGVEDQLFALDSAGVAAGAGLTALGGAITGATEQSKEWRETLGRTATTMGMARDETRALATEISNATFPMDDATATMDALARQGITTEEEMQEVATAADMVADATGETAASVAENAGPALAAMGEDVSDLNEHMDTFTYVARNTTMTVDDFSRMVRKTGPELQQMGMSVDETAAIMATLEERGMDSRTAMREFRQAARGAEGDQQALMDSLNLTSEELAAQKDALAAAEGTTKDHAEAANESISTMDRLGQALDEATLAAGGVLEPVEAAGPALMAMGGAMTTVSAINWAAVPSFSAVAAAAAPILPILLGLAAGSAALYAAWESNFLGIQNATSALFDALGSGFDWLKGVVADSISYVVELVMTIPEALGKAIDKIPGVDSEDVIGTIDTDAISESLFPPEPKKDGEKAGEAMGSGVEEGFQSSKPAYGSEGKSDGKEYASGFQSGVGEAQGIDIMSDGLTPEMRAAMESGVGGYVSDPSQMEDVPTEISTELYNAILDQQGSISPEDLGVSDEEFNALSQRAGYRGAINDTSGPSKAERRDAAINLGQPVGERSSSSSTSAQSSRGRSTSGRPRSSGGGSGRSLDDVVQAIKSLRSTVRSMTVDGEVAVTTDDETLESVIDDRVDVALRFEAVQTKNRGLRQ